MSMKSQYNDFYLNISFIFDINIVIIQLVSEFQMKIEIEIYYVYLSFKKKDESLMKILF